MGKLTSNELESLQKAGVFNRKTAESIKTAGLASSKTRSQIQKRYMKTNDGKWVSPTLYFRGATNSTPSDQMNEFKKEFNNLVDKFATVKESK